MAITLEKDLPSIPSSKKGWPWLGLPTSFAQTMPGGSPWPRISIVTPSFNQAQYIEETIRSVLLQGYPNLEYIIIDGGSTDGSVEIIKKYAPWLAYWVSEKDKGQSNAINKGFSMATGDILAWINSDDFYEPNIFGPIALSMQHANWIVGKTNQTDENGKVFSTESSNHSSNLIYDGCLKNGLSFDFPVAQPSHFWSSKILQKIGLLNERYHYCMDLDWMLRALANGEHPVSIDLALSNQRYQPNSKTLRSGWAFDFERAHIFFYLTSKGLIKLIPALRLFRKYLVRGLNRYSDFQYLNDKKVTSFCAVCLAYILSESRNWGDFKDRLNKMLRQPQCEGK